MGRYTYLTNELFNMTNSKLLRDEIDRDRLSIVVIDEKVFYVESRLASNRAYKKAVSETRRLFNIPYLYDF